MSLGDEKNEDPTKKLIFSVTDPDNKETRFLVGLEWIEKYSSLVRLMVEASVAEAGFKIIPLPNKSNQKDFKTLMKLLWEYDQSKTDYDDGIRHFDLNIADVSTLHLANFLFHDNSKTENGLTVNNDLGFFHAILKAAAPVLFDPRSLSPVTDASFATGGAAAAPPSDVELVVPYAIYWECIPYAAPRQLYRFWKELKNLDNPTHDNGVKRLMQDLDKLFIRFGDIELPAAINGSYYIAHYPTVPQQYISVTRAELEANFSHLYAIFRINPMDTLILDCGDARAIGDLNSSTVPESIKDLFVVGDHVTRVGDEFLAECTGVTQIDLPDHITNIGKLFLFRVSNTDIFVTPDSDTARAILNFDSALVKKFRDRRPAVRMQEATSDAAAAAPE